MSKRRVPSDERKTSVSPGLTAGKVSPSRSVQYRTAFGADEVVRFVGLSLAGGKTDKAALAVMEYFPKHKKIFLSRIFDKIKSDESISADLKICEILQQYRNEVHTLALDTPWQLPLCLTCTLKCPGFENCREPHVQWMWDQHRKRTKKKRPKKLFTPYTERCFEMFALSELEEVFTMNHAMGANSAPLLARAAFLKRRIDLPVIEVFPKLSLWRLGRTLGVMKSHLRFHRHSVGGDESRRNILDHLTDRNIAFVYQQDVKLMIENNHAFEAFLCALTAFLKFKDQTESRPESFPKSEIWIEFPNKKLDWDSIL